MLRTPPDILITTPESLYLLLTSQGGELLSGRDGDPRRGARGRRHEARRASLLSLERPRARRWRSRSADRPLAPSARWERSAAGSAARPRDQLVDAGQRKELDLEVVVPVEDMRELGASSRPLSQPVVQDGVEMDSGYEATSRSIWPSIYPALSKLVRAHRSTIVFVNNRPLCRSGSRCGSTRSPRRRSRAPTTARWRASSGC
jgi:ATP-dependent Lhr-like helicase